MKREPPFVYFLRMETSDRIKIGCSISPKVRQVTLQKWSPYPLVMLAMAPGDAGTEALIHQRFSESRRRGEWFEISTELLAFVDAVKRDGAIPHELLDADLSWLVGGFRSRNWQSLLSDVIRRHGLTEEGFAEALDCSPQSVRNWCESGISPRYLAKTIRYFGARGIVLTSRDFFAPRLLSAA